MRTARVLRFAALSLLLMASDLGAPIPLRASVTFETYTDRSAFDARLGSVRVVDFDDIDTSANDPAPFAATRYKTSHGVVINGEDGQFASPVFAGFFEFLPSSPPNAYAPGPISFVFNEGGNLTTLHFFAGVRRATVAGVGIVFIDADYPGDGPSSLEVFGEDGSELEETPTVVGSNGSKLFRGIVAVDDQSNQPVAVIASALVISGSGWLGNDNNEGVALDDLAFGGPTVAPGKSGEICDNCIDDDSDAYVDRLDGECDAPADGGATGLGDLAVGKVLLKCQKAIGKGGPAFAGGIQTLLQGCLGGVLQCVQVKPGDPKCVSKAQASCAKARAKMDVLAQKFRTLGGKACSTLSDMATFDAHGLGWDAETVDCARYGITLNGGADTGECTIRQHGCRAQQLVAQENARALELAMLGGLDVANDFPCLTAGANGNQNGLGDAKRGKSALKCQQAITKAGAAFAKKRQKLNATCYDSIGACLQLEPNDESCLSKAQAKCRKSDASVSGPSDDPKTLAGKAKAAILKKCQALPLADLFDAEGLGQGALAAPCQAIGLASLSSAADVAECLIAFHACRADRLTEKQYPRAIEFGGMVD